MATIMEALGGKGGQTIMEVLGGQGGQTIADVISEKEIDIKDNPLAALAMDFDISDSIDLLGKVASDLQEDMIVNAAGKVTGTSKYVTGYTGFSGDPAEQEGNYVAFHISVGELVIGTNVTVKVNNVTMDPDGLHVMIFRDGSKNPKAIVEASADGHKTIKKVFDFTEVVRMPAEDDEESEVSTAPEPEPEVVKYTVTYNANGGTGTIEPVEVVAGESITVDDGSGLTPPANDEALGGDLAFAGWAKTSSAQSATVVSPFTPDKNTTLYAVWTVVSPISG